MTVADEPFAAGTVPPPHRSIAMTDPVQNLSQFNLAEIDDGYLLEIIGDAGGKLTLAAAPEQLDAIIDALVALLEDDDADSDDSTPA
jgi:hypothetical protein